MKIPRDLIEKLPAKFPATMQTKFIEVHPLFLRMFHEKVSNFQKVFYDVLSQNFMIFLKNLS